MFMTLVQGPRKKENGKMGFGIRFAPSERPAFELRYRSPPAPRPAPGAPPPADFILTLVYRMIVPADFTL
jgi:hypothetical protein